MAFDEHKFLVSRSWMHHLFCSLCFLCIRKPSLTLGIKIISDVKSKGVVFQANPRGTDFVYKLQKGFIFSFYFSPYRTIQLSQHNLLKSCLSLLLWIVIVAINQGSINVWFCFWPLLVCVAIRVKFCKNIQMKTCWEFDQNYNESIDHFGES